MKLVHPYYFPPIEINDVEPSILVIENNLNYRKVVSELIEQINTGEGDYVLSEKGKALKLSKEAVFISDLFRLNFDNRQIKGRLLQTLLNDAQDYDSSLLIQGIVSLGSDLSFSSKYPIGFNTELAQIDLLKLLDFYIDVDGLSMVEKIIQYMTLCCELLDTHLIIMLNALDIMSKEEYEEFKKEISYNHIPMLMIEHRTQNYLYHSDKVMIIDDDLCIT